MSKFLTIKQYARVWLYDNVEIYPAPTLQPDMKSPVLRLQGDLVTCTDDLDEDGTIYLEGHLVLDDPNGAPEKYKALVGTRILVSLVTELEAVTEVPVP